MSKLFPNKLFPYRATVRVGADSLNDLARALEYAAAEVCNVDIGYGGEKEYRKWDEAIPLSWQYKATAVHDPWKPRRRARK